MSEDFSGSGQRAFYGRPQHETTDCRDPERLAVEADEGEIPCERAVYARRPHYRPDGGEAAPLANPATAQTA